MAYDFGADYLKWDNDGKKVCITRSLNNRLIMHCQGLDWRAETMKLPSSWCVCVRVCVSKGKCVSSYEVDPKWLFLFVYYLHACTCLADPMLTWADGKFQLGEGEKPKFLSLRGCGLDWLISLIELVVLRFVFVFSFHPQLLLRSSSLHMSYQHYIYLNLSLILWPLIL